MIDDGIGFQQAPWQPVLDKRIGQHITGIMRDAWRHRTEFWRETGVRAMTILNRHLPVAMGPDRRHR
jgi:hypothetical protein